MSSVAEDLLSVASSINEIKVLFDNALPKVLELSADLRPGLESFVDFQVEMTDRAIKKYVKLGYTKKEAITLVLYNKQSLLQAKSAIK